MHSMPLIAALALSAAALVACDKKPTLDSAPPPAPTTTLPTPTPTPLPDVAASAPGATDSTSTPSPAGGPASGAMEADRPASAASS